MGFALQQPRVLTDKWLERDPTMNIVLDDKPCDLDAGTVGEAIETAADLAREAGRLIVEVTVDGSRWSRTELGSAEALSGEAGEVRLKTADPAELVRQTFGQAAAALISVDSLQRQAAELLQSDDTITALGKLESAIALWQSIQQAVIDGARVANIELESIAAGELPITAAIDTLNERLTVIARALQESDPIGLADTLLYEFPEVVTQWRAILGELQNRVA